MATFALFGLRLGALPIGDNSAFTHLRTGRLIADSGAIPRRDPYSFTARGEEWVVQSWLPEWTYGWLWRTGGLHWVVVEQALLMAAVAWTVALAARTGSSLRTAAAAGIAIGVGAPYWVPRPLLFGILALALTVLVVERRRSPLLLLPIVWVWVNSHGSFPLGLLWIGAVALGVALDERSAAAARRALLPYGVAFVAGIGLSMLNPLGYRLLTFPFTLGEKREIFKTVIEWRSPNFQQTGPLISLVFLLVALAVLARRRTGYRDVVPVLGFLAMAMVAARNLPMLAVVLAPALARAMGGGVDAEPAGITAVGGEGHDDADVPRSEISRLPGVVAAVLAIAAALTLYGIWRQPAIDQEGYPVAAVDFLESEGLLGTARMAHQDTPGGYLILREGRDATVFIDDRVDMYPVSVSDDYAALLNGRRSSLAVLRRWDVDVVLWQRGRPLSVILELSGGWRRVFLEDGWAVYVRT